MERHIAERYADCINGIRDMHARVMRRFLTDPDTGYMLLITTDNPNTSDRLYDAGECREFIRDFSASY